MGSTVNTTRVVRAWKVLSNGKRFCHSQSEISVSTVHGVVPKIREGEALIRSFCDWREMGFCEVRLRSRWSREQSNCIENY